MISLLRIELYKLFVRPRTWIAFAVMAMIMALINGGLWLEGEEAFEFLFKSLRDQFFFEGNLINGYLITYIALNTLWVHIPVLLVIVTADLVSGEHESGTIRLILSRKVGRTQFLLVKFFTAFIYVLLFMLFLVFISLLPSLLLFGGGDLIVLIDGVQILLESEARGRFVWAFLYGALSMASFASLSVMLSTWIRNSIAAILASLGILVISTLLHTFAFGLFDPIKSLLPSYHMAQWQLLFLRDIPMNEIWFSIAYLVGFGGLMMLLSILKYKRVQITD